MEKRITYAFWGSSNGESWLDWYREVKSLFCEIGHEVNYLGVEFESYNPSKLVTARRKEKEIVQKMTEGEIPRSLELFSIPDGFRTAIFDHDMYCARTDRYICYTLYERDMGEETEKQFIRITERYFSPERGEAFSTSVNDVPLIYISTGKAGNIRSFELIKTLKF